MTLSQSQQKWLFFIGLTVFLLLMSSPALASQGQGGGLPYESWLNNLRQSVTVPGGFRPVHHRHCRCRWRTDLRRRTERVFPHFDFPCVGNGFAGRSAKHDVLFLRRRGSYRCRAYRTALPSSLGVERIKP